MRLRWDAIGVAVAVALAGIVLAVPSHPRVIAAGLVGVGLLIFILTGVGRRADVTDLIRLKEEGTALLNRDPMTFLKRGDKNRDPAQALTLFQIAVTLWLEDALPRLRQAGATDGEVSHFTTIITYTPAQPAMSEAHAAEKGILAERLHRLQPIITRLEGET